MKYRPEIDGLRALAVVPVILFHSGFELFSGGFVGVDIFFVISGYLITTIIIEDIENNRFSITNFYERRARRILPALFFVMLVCIPFAWMWMLPSEMKNFSQSLVAVVFFVSNILFWRESGYFDTASEEKPLLHTWSLAVEEQYYVLFPLFLIFAWRFGKNRVFWMIVIMASISLLLSEWGWRNKATFNFYLAPTRVWELFSGSIVSFIIHRRGVKKNNTLALLGLAAIIFSIFIYDESTPFPSLYALTPVLGVMLFVLYAEKETLAAKLLRTKLMVGIGLISYSSYLWHQPLFAFARIKLINQPSELLMISLSFLSIILGYFSWKYVENPFRKHQKIPFSKRFIFSLATVGTFGFLIFGMLGHYNNGFSDRFSELVKGDVDHLLYHKYLAKKYFDCEPPKIANAALTWKGFLRCKQSKHGEYDWLLLGDSHAEHLFLGLAKENPETNIAFYIFGEAPYLKREAFKEIFEVIGNTKNLKTIFLTMHYFSRVDNFVELKQGFGNTIKYLQNLGHRVVIIGDIPNFDINPESCKYDKNIQKVLSYCSMPIAKFQRQKDIYEPTLIELSSELGVPFITIYEPLCNDTRCNMILNETILYRDNNHLNIPGSILVGKFLSQKLNKVLKVNE